MPLLRLPIHFTYLAFLAGRSPAIARAYFRTALAFCRLLGVGPSMLLHPLDFLGPGDEPDLAFMPGMRTDWPTKRRLMDTVITQIRSRWRLATVAEHAAAHAQGDTSAARRPRQPAEGAAP